MPDEREDTEEQQVETTDLNLLDSLEDESKSPAELWAEFDAAEGQPAAAETASAEDAGSPASDAAGEGATADDDAAATETQDTDGAAGSGAADQAAAAPASQDPWANASPELRAAFEAEKRQWEERDRRLRGQVAGYERRLNEARQGSAGRGQPPERKPAAEVDLETEEGWKAFESEYPEVAGPVARRIRAQEERIARLEQGQSRVEEQAQIDHVEEQTDLLESQHPDWREIAATPEFEGWVTTQPRYIQEAAARNGNKIVDAAEAADLIGRYKEAFRSQREPQTGPSGNADNRAPQQGTNGSTSLSARRQRQLEAASGARSSGPGGAALGVPEDGDPQAIWNAFDELEARQARRA